MKRRLASISGKGGEWNEQVYSVKKGQGGRRWVDLKTTIEHRRFQKGKGKISREPHSSIINADENNKNNNRKRGGDTREREGEKEREGRHKGHTKTSDARKPINRGVTTTQI